jgi:hypothetical protein
MKQFVSWVNVWPWRCGCKMVSIDLVGEEIALACRLGAWFLAVKMHGDPRSTSTSDAYVLLVGRGKERLRP